jgi:HTH-type transcriptional regulator/antitoxin HigA
MIKSDKQLTVTRKRLVEFKNAYDQLKAEVLSDPIIRKAQMEALQSQIEVFEKEIQEYESLKTGTIPAIPVSSIRSLPEGLIKTRIARGWSQAVLAEKIGVAEQQVQRDEANNYDKASLSRIAEIADILNLDFHGRFKELTQPDFPFSDEVKALAARASQKVQQSKCLFAF